MQTIYTVIDGENTYQASKRKCIIANSLSHTYTCVYILFTLSSEAVVGLENTFYEVSEGVGLVEVCAIVNSPSIDCPIPFPFNVKISVINNTAGIVIKSSFTLL